MIIYGMDWKEPTTLVITRTSTLCWRGCLTTVCSCWPKVIDGPYHPETGKYWYSRPYRPAWVIERLEVK